MTKNRGSRKKPLAKRRRSSKRAPRSKPEIKLNISSKGYCPDCYKSIFFDRSIMDFLPHTFTATGEPCEPDLDEYQIKTYNGHVTSALRAKRIRSGDGEALDRESFSRQNSEEFSEVQGERRTVLGGSMMSSRKRF
ncbi:hypothetical protein [Corynebacterium glutamicum]|uniref:hypothetical protein n=1 Tax=Corynebacterium glutamicum TaxID=1718 RepID=UPI00117745D5|nr:hypothetical protein [Corynebacterium glutamicum]NII88213.1 hypothetical protein [Corynebacterium glutamicum]